MLQDVVKITTRDNSGTASSDCTCLSIDANSIPRIIFVDTSYVFTGYSNQPNHDINTDLDSYEIMLASENALKQIWDTPEEDEAWAHLKRAIS